MHGTSLFPQFQAPAAYTKEAFGVEYLYAQSGFMFHPKDEELEEKIDEGFCDGEEVENDEQAITVTHSEDMATVALLTDIESDD